MGLLALRRYVPYLRPYIGLVVVFGVSQLGGLATAASIPKVIQYIIDGPITHHQLSQLLPMAGLLVLIGLLEGRNNRSVFKAAGQEMVFGGFEISPRK